MNKILQGLRSNPLLWLLAAVPAVFLGEHFAPESHTTLFVLAVLAIVPLAALLSHATESVAAKTGDAVGGLLNATLGNLTELVIAITALRAGMFDLVKASIAGAIVTNSLFMLGMAFLLGGLKYRVQEYNAGTARLQAGMLFLAAVALVVPSASVAPSDRKSPPSCSNSVLAWQYCCWSPTCSAWSFRSRRTRISLPAPGKADTAKTSTSGRSRWPW